MSDMSNGRILVTGATGVAGSAVIREFIRNGHPVKALVRNRAKARAYEAFPTVEVVEGDMARPETLDEAFFGTDRLLLISSPDERMLDRQTGFIDAAQKAGVRHVVKFSGLSAADVGTPFVFGSMHADVERHLKKWLFDLDGAIARQVLAPGVMRGCSATVRGVGGCRGF